MADTQLDEMRISDLPEVLAIERASFPDPWSLTAFLDEFRNRFAGCLVAGLRGANRVGGYAVYVRAADELHVNTVAVAASLRGHGLGRRLVAEVLERGASAGARNAWLEVRPSNLAARALYASFGFELRGRRRGYYSGDGEDALVLSRVIVAQEPSAGGQEKTQ